MFQERSLEVGKDQGCPNPRTKEGKKLNLRGVARVKGSDQRKVNLQAKDLKIDWITCCGCLARGPSPGDLIRYTPFCVEKFRPAVEEARDGLPEILQGHGIRPMIELRHGSDLQENPKLKAVRKRKRHLQID